MHLGFCTTELLIAVIWKVHFCPRKSLSAGSIVTAVETMPLLQQGLWQKNDDIIYSYGGFRHG